MLHPRSEVSDCFSLANGSEWEEPRLDVRMMLRRVDVLNHESGHDAVSAIHSL